jgi:hypothetical protein
VLDWQFFRNPACAGWPVPGIRWRWLATPAMRGELAHVLARGFAPRWTTPITEVLDFFDRHACMVAPPPANALMTRTLRCSDPDDQKFIDLVAGRPGRWLVSRDRAVLKLRRRAFALTGARIVDPAGWRPGADQP